MDANEISEPNKIHYTRHSFSDYYGDDSEDSSDSEDDCPECFEEIGDRIMQEWGKKTHKHSSHGNSRYYDDDYINSKGHKAKKGYGETIMQDGSIRSEYGHGGRSSHGTARHFSFNTDDFRRGPNTRHYETKGHRNYDYDYDLYSDSESDDLDDYYSDDDSSEDENDYGYHHYDRRIRDDPFEIDEDGIDFNLLP